MEKSGDHLIVVLPGSSHLLLQRVADKHEILQLGELGHVFELAPLANKVVGHVKDLRKMVSDSNTMIDSMISDYHSIIHTLSLVRFLSGFSLSTWL